MSFLSAAACRGRSRYLLRILTALTCGVFLFVFYFVSSVQQQAKLQQSVSGGLEQESESQESAVAGTLARTARCALPLYWAGQSNNFTVLYNYVPAEWGAPAFESSITYTTHATSAFIAHAEQVALRWAGPVSVAVYAPATDFAASLLAIQYLRQCRAPAVRRHVTFHLFFDATFKPDAIPCSLDEAAVTVDCDTYDYPNTSFQAEKRLTYPVNVARNIARISAQTQYVLPSDIELYPSVGLIPMFLEMIEQQRRLAAIAANATTTTTIITTPTTTTIATTKTKEPATNSSVRSNRKRRAVSGTNTTGVPATVRTKSAAVTGVKPATSVKNATKAATANNKSGAGTKVSSSTTKAPARSWPAPTVYVLPLFEVEKTLPAPENKSELLALLKSGKAVPFHKFVCPECHRVPKQEDWLRQATTGVNGSSSSMGVLYSTKRHKPFQNWEPIYIGTNAEPLYDERLNWEGMSDKMTQAFEMCLMDYNFSILDNAFLVHAPGIKRYNKTLSQWRKDYVSQNHKLRRQIKKELLSKYSPNPKCSL